MPEGGDYFRLEDIKFFLGRKRSVFVLPGSVQIFSIVRKTQRVHGRLDLICEFNLLFVQFHILHDHLVHVVLRFS